MTLTPTATTDQVLAEPEVRGKVPEPVAAGESVIECPSTLNVLKDTYDHSG
jgi:hypothetical protein